MNRMVTFLNLVCAHNHSVWYILFVGLIILGILDCSVILSFILILGINLNNFHPFSVASHCLCHLLIHKLLTPFLMPLMLYPLSPQYFQPFLMLRLPTCLLYHSREYWHVKVSSQYE